ncbi:MAG: zinc metalloprotease, partial [Planctomycetota bacterium]
MVSASMDWGTSPYGGGWFTTAMHEISHTLGFGHSYDMPPETIMGESPDPTYGVGSSEGVFPGDHDIVHGQYIYRPDSNDIDLYRFTLETAGLLSAETIAERLGATSQLDSTLTLFQEEEVQGGDGQLITEWQVVSRNDDYYSEDSYLELDLEPGTYYLGVTSTGNIDYDPRIENSGIGGTSQGVYDLRVNFVPDVGEHMVDATATMFDGDADGIPGGVYNFWFNVQSEQNTIFVDKAAAGPSHDGSLADPYTVISDALAAAEPGDIVRIVGNNFQNDDPADPATMQDNQAYEIGTDVFGDPLRDGAKMEIPQGVTVMIDAGAVFKLRKANLDVGSSAQGIDRSLGALQVLGTPEGTDGEPLRSTVPAKGDWGGLVFRNDLDYDDGHTVLEEEGIFLNYVNHADISFGGGSVIVNSIQDVYNPIHMIEARPTVSFNTITNSADAAISADPNSFEDTKFQGHMNPVFTADYQRVGPDVHGNHLVENTINGIFVRIRTDAGRPLDELEVNARFDDTDVVHVISENLVIKGTPGGATLEEGVVPLTLLDTTHIEVTADGSQFEDGRAFSISDGLTTVLFEMELAGTGLIAGDVEVLFHSTMTPAEIAESLVFAINSSSLSVTATSSGGIVTLSGPVDSFEGITQRVGRLDARLAIDPAIIVKMDSSRIEAEIGTQFIAEGKLGQEVRFTSLSDNRFGAGGTFITAEDPAGSGPAAGDWGGLYFGPVSQSSIDHALIAHAGGTTSIEGGFARFNPIEIHQASVRITNSVLDDNSDGGAGDRHGRGSTVSSTVFVRGAQPVIAENVLRRNEGPVISIDANSMQWVISPDWGRSTGQIDRVERYADNHGPLVRGNRLGDDRALTERTQIHGMEVRGGTLTTETIWDDTDIVHVVYDEIVVPNHHTYSGLRLQSSLEESLVVKLGGSSAGFTAAGTPQEIDDRIGGTVQIMGVPGHPVVLTSLADDSFGAGLDPTGQPQRDTNNDGLNDDPDSALQGAQPAAGDWRSVKLDRYSNDRNVAVVNEVEEAYGATEDINADPLIAQYIGDLGPHEKGGDDNLRLGFQVNGFIRFDDPGDVDVYSFKAEAGCEVWLDIDRTTHALDTVVELIDADGFILAASDDSYDEQNGVSAPTGLGMTMDRDIWLSKDFGTTNPRDAGMRVVLPGPEGETRTYYVRVSSAGGVTQGAYELQVRLRELQEYAGSTVRYANIHYATNGIELYGLPTHSPLLGDTTEVEVGIPAASQTTIPGPSPLLLTAMTPGPSLDGTEVVIVDSIGFFVDYRPGTLTVFRPPDAPAWLVALAISEHPLVIGPGGGVFMATLAGNQDDGTATVPSGTYGPTTGGDQLSTNNNTVATAQYLGNLVDSDRNSIQLGGYLDGPGDIDWYRFSVDLDKLPPYGSPESTFPVTFDIDYADGMERPNATIWVFDAYGRLIYSSRDSNVVDDRPGPGEGADIDNLERGTVGALDPFIGPVTLPEWDGTPRDYFVAVTAQDVFPWSIRDRQMRWEPIDSLWRIAEDHVGSWDTSSIGGRPYPNNLEPWPYSTPLFPNMNLHADDFHLGDVVLYVTTGGDLYTVDPFTGAFETDVTNRQAASDLLPDVFPRPWLTYGDIAMRNDGMLFSYTGFGSAPNIDQNQVAGQFRRFDTGDAKNLLLDNDNDINTYWIDPQSGNMVIDNASGLQFDALVHLPVTRDRRVYAVGHRQPENGVEFVRNLLYRFDEDGVAIQYPNLATNPRLPTDIVPVARLLTGPAIKVPIDATDVVYDPIFLFNDPGDLLDGVRFTFDDGSELVTFEFDAGPDVRLDPTSANASRDGEVFTLNDGTTAATFEFNSGPVLVHGDAGTLVDGDTFTLQDDAGALRYFEFNDVSDPN